LRGKGRPGLQSEFQDSQGYTEKLCLKKPKKKKKKKKEREREIMLVKAQRKVITHGLGENNV
jgi:hypothetical protein